ncbi:hypothetical protein KAU25_05630 [Candidatus Bathyarchaeota archaeon]|nr:hypothetical protein [Candidatus Bathyarchaeota archaeon]
MARKGLSVWILGSLTFLAGLHSLDAFFWLAGMQEQSFFLSNYPEILANSIGSILYMILSISSTFLLWGGTASVALQNPIENFLGKVLEDGKRENESDVELLEAKTSVLEMMSETLSDNSGSLSKLTDVVFNIRSSILRLETMNQNVEALKLEVKSLRKSVQSLKTVKRTPRRPRAKKQVIRTNSTKIPSAKLQLSNAPEKMMPKNV